MCFVKFKVGGRVQSSLFLFLNNSYILHDFCVITFMIIKVCIPMILRIKLILTYTVINTFGLRCKKIEVASFSRSGNLKFTPKC